jgi:hypothetical protein
MSEPAPTHNEVSVAGFEKGLLGVTPPSSRDGHRGVFLTDLIVELGFAERRNVDEAEEAARTSDRTVEQLLLDAGTIDERQLSLAVAERHGLDHVDLREFEVDMKAAECVSRSVAARSHAVPIAFAPDGALIVAVGDTFDALAIPRLETTTGREVRPVVATVTGIRRLIERLPDEAIDQAPEPEVPRIKSQRELEVDELVKPKDDALSSFDGLSMDLGPVSMEPPGSKPPASEPTEEEDADGPDEGAKESLLARDLSKTKEEVAELKRRLKEAVTAAQDAVAANERLNALRRTIDGKDS